LDYSFHVILDQRGKLSGTVTDDGIRRGLLKGASLDDPISICIHWNSICGRLGAEVKYAAHLDRVGFRPIVDEKGVVV
jgi:hypothetical protein